MNETDVRSRILAVATRLFGQQGYGATSVREVVDGAGVTKPTLYYWFANKEALFVEAVRAQVEVLRGIVADTLCCEQVGLEQRLSDFLERYIRSARNDVDGVRLMLTAHHPSGDGQPDIDILTVQRDQLSAVVDVIERARRSGEVRSDVDSNVAALSLVGAANLHIVAALHGVPLPEDIHVRIVRTFLHGVLS
ncbi:MAG: TetR/AcrR family transcriptional regulator [Alphaproteobacteria bacterium]|nr:TetR/AcrR family transcriptional regulator [Alphaproteobacteria bacterium]